MVKYILIMDENEIFVFVSYNIFTLFKMIYLLYLI